MTTRLSTLLAAMTLLVASAVGAQEPPASAAAQNVKIHGRWTIEIRNQDGSLVSRSEFRNALAPDAGLGGGASILAYILGSKRPTGIWGIRFYSNGANTVNGPCVPPITPPNGYPCGPSESNGLTVTVPMTGNPPRPTGVIELSGSFTIPLFSQANHISRVETTATICNDAGGCFPIPFTSHTLDAVIPIVAGQIVQVKVVLSFS